jgi:hypothetical protein
MSLVLQSSGGGSVTLQEAVTASNLTITVPAVTGTMLTTASTGTVLQVIQFSSVSAFTTTSTSFTDATGFNASITPSSASSKILILFNAFISSSSANNYTWARVVRGATEVIPSLVQIQPDTFSLNGLHIASAKLDSPATTSSVTYQVQVKAEAGGSTAKLGQGAGGGSDCGPTVITLLEIAG